MTESGQDEKRGLERLSDALKSKGILFNGLARDLGVDTSLVSKYLNGKAPIPAEHLHKICVEALGVGADSELYAVLFEELGQHPPGGTAAAPVISSQAPTATATATASAPQAPVVVVATAAATPAPQAAAAMPTARPPVLPPTPVAPRADETRTAAPKTSMETLSGQFEDFLKHSGFNVVGRTASSDQQLFFLPFAAGRTVRVQIDDAHHKITAVVPLPHRLPEERGEERMRVLESLAAFNWRFVPQASGDLNDGEICIEHGVELRAPVALPREFFHALIATCLSGYQHLNQALVNVLYKGKDATEAMEAASTDIEKPIERAKV